MLDETLEAQGLLRQVEARASGALRSDAQLGLARIALLQGEREEARRLLGQLALSPTAAQRREAQILRAQLLLSARPKETASAQALLLSVLAEAKEQPEQIEAHHLLARIFRDAGQLRAAREQLQKALQIDDQPALRRELGQLALDEGDPALARKQYELLLQGDVQDPELLIQAARAYRLPTLAGSG